MVEIILTSVSYEVAALLVLTSTVGLLGLALRQSLIAGFALVGIVGGLAGFGFAVSAERIELLAELGTAVLRLKLDLHLFRSIDALAQISEFSLIFMAMGLALGHVDTQAVGLVTLLGLTTIALSIRMITYSQTLYLWLERLPDPFERKIAVTAVISGDAQTLRERGADLLLMPFRDAADRAVDSILDGKSSPEVRCGQAY